MSASQNHGEIWEDLVVQKITQLSKSEYDKTKPNGYNSKWDIDEPYDLISIKTTGGDGVGMGDIERIYDSLDPSIQTKPWTLSVAVYSQINGTHKQFQTVYELTIDPKLHRELFTTIPKETIKEFADYVRSIEPGETAQLANQRLWKARRKSIFETHKKKLLSINAKIDSNSQRRTQTGIKISEAIKAGVPYVKYTEEYKGIKLPLTIESPRRKRNA